MIEKLKSKKGFTLVELCIVIAIMGIVVSMVVTFIAQYNKDTFALLRNRNAMGDINIVRQMTNEWMRYYDNENYTIAPSDAENGSYVLQAKDKDGNVDKISISNGKIVWEKGGTVYKEHILESVTDGKFTFSVQNENSETPIIKCRVYFNKGNNWHEMLFSIMTKTPRSRYSPAEI